MKIFVIDDEPSLVVAMQYYLASERYNVSTAGSGHSAFMKARDYDCVQVDITLPAGNCHRTEGGSFASGNYHRVD